MDQVGESDLILRVARLDETLSDNAKDLLCLICQDIV